MLQQAVASGRAVTVQSESFVDPVQVLEASESRLRLLEDDLDRRAGFVLVAAMGLVALGLSLPVPREPDWAAWAHRIGLWAGCLSLLVCSASMVPPRRKANPQSLVFFRGIMARSADQYRRELSLLKATDYSKQLALECHVLAGHLRRKSIQISVGIGFFVVSAILCLVSRG